MLRFCLKKSLQKESNRKELKEKIIRYAMEQLEVKINKIMEEIKLLNQKFEDHFLTDGEKNLIDETMKEKQEGNLINLMQR